MPITGLADPFVVNCPSGGVGVYPSINMALQTGVRASSDRNHTVTISGTCTENVDVTDFENVELVGTTGATITASGGQAVHVGASKNITLHDLNIHGVSNQPVIWVSDSTASIRGCTIEGGTHGVLTDGNASVMIGDSSVIRDNSQNGISISPGSTASIRGKIDVLDNNGYGIDAGGSVVFNGGGQQQTLARNRVGLVTGGTAASSGVLPLLIKDNVDAGVSSFNGGSIILRGAIIQNNGGPASLWPLSAGVLVNVNASAVLLNVQILDNLVTGLAVQENSSVVMNASTVTGNGAEGIRVETQSGIRFGGSPSSITNNTGADLACDSNTYVIGASFADVGKASCRGFKKK